MTSSFILRYRLQFIPDPMLATSSPTQIRHSHDLDHQARPAGEVLRPLALARLGVVLFPREARLFPALVYRVDDILAQARVQVGGPLLVGPVLGCHVLHYE